MVLYDLLPDPLVSALIMQIAAFGAASRTGNRANHPERFVGLRDLVPDPFDERHFRYCFDYFVATIPEPPEIELHFAISYNLERHATELAAELAAAVEEPSP